jgi:hypothetical protein
VNLVSKIGEETWPGFPYLLRIPTMPARKSWILVLRSSPEEGSNSMRNQLGALLLFVVFLNPFMGDALAQNQPGTTAVPARLETEILKTIVFITVDARKPGRLGRSFPYFGTGFLVSVPDDRIPRIPPDRTNVYLVTNRHIAQGIDQDEKGNCEALQIDKMSVMLNLKIPVNGIRTEQVQGGWPGLLIRILGAPSLMVFSRAGFLTLVLRLHQCTESMRTKPVSFFA